MKLHPSSGTGGRSVSLLDLEGEGATIDPVVPTLVATTGPTPTPTRVVAKVVSTAIATSSVQPSKVLEGAVSKDTGAIATVAREDPVGDIGSLNG